MDEGRTTWKGKADEQTGHSQNAPPKNHVSDCRANALNLFYFFTTLLDGE